jgi:hypothetical protein
VRHRELGPSELGDAIHERGAARNDRQPASGTGQSPRGAPPTSVADSIVPGVRSRSREAASLSLSRHGPRRRVPRDELTAVVEYGDALMASAEAERDLSQLKLAMQQR